MHFTDSQIQTALWIWMGVAMAAFLYLLYKPAPYGRHNRSGWGPQISNRLGWIFMEAVVLFCFWYWLWPLTSLVNKSLYFLILPAAFTVHYVHRSFVFPFFLRTKGKKMPLIIMLSAVCFNLVNGNALGWTFSRTEYEPAPVPVFFVGLGLWVIGLLVNIRHDYMLISLRKNQEGYVEPRGGLFSKIWSPNLWAEMVEWLGFALMGGTLACWVFFVWTVANLAPRALSHARWYRERFPDAPRRWF